MDIYQHMHNSIIDINEWRSFLDNANTFKTKCMYVQICSPGNTSMRPYLPLGQYQSVSTLVFDIKKNNRLTFHYADDFSLESMPWL